MKKTNFKKVVFLLLLAVCVYVPVMCALGAVLLLAIPFVILFTLLFVAIKSATLPQRFY